METDVRATVVSSRIPALDWMRGVVVILMMIDHASSSFNSHRLIIDGAAFYEAGMTISISQFAIRWITHLCAPTFVFLAGTALALSTDKQQRQGVFEREIDLSLGVRGVLLVLFEVLWIQWWWGGSQGVILQVFFALGVGFLLMIPLRRCKVTVLFLLSVSLILFTEALGNFSGSKRSLAVFFLQPKAFEIAGIKFLLIYPILPWLAVMILGWTFGSSLLWQQKEAVRGSLHSEGEKGGTPERGLIVWGVFAIIAAAIVRYQNGYGNEHLLRENDSLVQWFILSKYPPSFSYLAAQLGILGVLLGTLFSIQRSLLKEPSERNPLLVFGQTALFFYLLHLPLLKMSAMLFGFSKKCEIPGTLLASGGALLVLYPLCRWYRSLKRKRKGVLRYI